MKEFFIHIFGTVNPVDFAAFLFFAYIAAAAHMIFDVAKRDPISPNTPIHFSLSFWLKDNAARIITAGAIIFIIIRFTPEITGMVLPSPLAINDFSAFCIGLTWEVIWKHFIAKVLESNSNTTDAKQQGGTTT